MDMVDMAKAMREFGTALRIAGFAEDQIPIIVGAASGVIIALRG